MVPSSVVTYPRVIESYEDPPAGLSSPYASQHIGVSLPLVPFSKTPSERDWSLYGSWVKEIIAKKQRKKLKGLDDLILGIIPVLSVTRNMAHGRCDSGQYQVHFEITSFGTVRFIPAALLLYKINERGSCEP